METKLETKPPQSETQQFRKTWNYNSLATAIRSDEKNRFKRARQSTNSAKLSSRSGSTSLRYRPVAVPDSSNLSSNRSTSKSYRGYLPVSATFKPKKMNDKSETLLLRRFNTEFSQVVRDVTDSQQLPRMVHYTQFTGILKRLRLIRETHTSVDPIDSQVLAMWNFLTFVHDKSYGYSPSIKPESFAGRTLTGDLKIFLMAVCGIKGNKRINVNEDNLLEKRISAQLYGYINRKKQLCLDGKDT